jgi:peptide chain release factor 1
VTVAVLPIPQNITSYINIKDVEFREVNLGGNGGQHRNRHYTDIIAKHQPTGIVVTARGRSQATNKENAIQKLAAEILELQRSNALKQTNKQRRGQVGSGMRGDKIRTINVKEGIVRCELTGQKKALGTYMKGDISF